MGLLRAPGRVGSKDGCFSFSAIICTILQTEDVPVFAAVQRRRVFGNSTSEPRELIATESTRVD